MTPQKYEGVINAYEHFRDTGTFLGEDPTQKQYASESGHWYSLIDGSAVNVVPNKSKPGEFRPTTLRDAKALGYLCPSVTEVLKTTYKPMLEVYKLKQVVKACIEKPMIGGEDEAEYTSFILQASKEHAATAAQRGTDIHASIEHMLATGAIHTPYDRGASLALDALQIDWRISSSERSFACEEGYGGKVDLHCNQPPFSSWVVDFKTKDDWDEGDKLGYDENVMQLAAYANGLGMIQDGLRFPRLVSIFLSRDVPGKWTYREWSEVEGLTALKKFRLLLEYWFLDKNHRPKLPEL